MYKIKYYVDLENLYITQQVQVIHTFEDILCHPENIMSLISDGFEYQTVFDDQLFGTVEESQTYRLACIDSEIHDLNVLCRSELHKLQYYGEWSKDGMEWFDVTDLEEKKVELEAQKDHKHEIRGLSGEDYFDVDENEAL